MKSVVLSLYDHKCYPHPVEALMIAWSKQSSPSSWTQSCPSSAAVPASVQLQASGKAPGSPTKECGCSRIARPLPRSVGSTSKQGPGWSRIESWRDPLQRFSDGVARSSPGEPSCWGVAEPLL